MLLAIDVGNTQTVIGVYEGASLHRMWRVATNKKHTPDELRLKVLPLLEYAEYPRECFQGSVLASVVPYLTSAWCDALESMLGTAPLVCNAQTAGSLFEA